jgi:elongation factor G
MIVVNAFDKEETDFEKALAQIREHFGERVFPLTIPLNAGPGFNQVLDIPRNEVITYASDKSGKFTESQATGALADRVKQLHEQLIEYIAESDDSLQWRNSCAGAAYRKRNCERAFMLPSRSRFHALVRHLSR